MNDEARRSGLEEPDRSVNQASPQVVIEDRLAVEAALAARRDGLDFADALHLATRGTCDVMASFDDRKFARRAAKPGLASKVSVPR